MELISLTPITRNGEDFTSPMLVDPRDISRPIIESDSGDSIIYLQEFANSQHRETDALNQSVQYIVDEDIATVVGLSLKIFSGTIITRNGRVPSETTVAFITDWVVGPIYEENGNSKFLYKEGGDMLPVEYEIDETIAQILVQIS